MKHKLHKINLVNIISLLFIIYMLQWVTLATYLKWGKDSVLVIKIIEEDGTKFVVKIWCKVCAKYISEKLRELNGSTKTAALAFLDGMENIKSSNVNIIFYSIFFKLKGFCVNFVFLLNLICYANIQHYCSFNFPSHFLCCNSFVDIIFSVLNFPSFSFHSQ